MFVRRHKFLKRKSSIFPHPLVCDGPQGETEYHSVYSQNQRWQQNLSFLSSRWLDSHVVVHRSYPHATSTLSSVGEIEGGYRCGSQLWQTHILVLLLGQLCHLIGG